MLNFLAFVTDRLRTTIVAAVLLVFPGLPALADDALIFNPRTYLLDGKLVLTPTPDMIVWDGGIASRVGSTWVGDGWSRYPGGRGALTTRMLNAMEEPDPVILPRRRIRTDCSHDCECQLLMWRSWP